MKLFVGIVSVVSFFLITSFKNFPTKKTTEKTVMDFSLKNTDGKFISLKDYPNAKGFMIVFTCNHCPFAKLYPPRLNALNEEFAPLGVPLIAISSTDTIQYEADGYLHMVEKSKNENFNFPYLYDGTQKVAKQFKADKTPHAYLIWKENNKWVIKYNGAIDDNGAEVEKVKNAYLSMAVETLLKGHNPQVTETKSIGCQIHFRK